MKLAFGLMSSGFTKLERTKMRTFESEIGRELRYAMLAASDFGYRLNMNDKLVRDVMDYPHRIVFDRLNIGLK